MPLFDYFIVFFLGLEFGSFANVCIYRWPRNLSVMRPHRSRCPWCARDIAWYDNLPVLSFILLRARCRECRSPISLRYPVVELSVALLWLAGYAALQRSHVDPSRILTAAIFFFLFAAVVVFMTDIDWRIIPDEMSFGLIIVGLLASPWNGLLRGETFQGRLVEAALGVGAGAGMLLVVSEFGRRIFKKEAMGGGDVKLLAGIGAYLGWWGAVTTLMAASILGGVAAVGGLGFGYLRRHQYLPFGPFIVLAALAMLAALLIDPSFPSTFF